MNERYPIRYSNVKFTDKSVTCIECGQTFIFTTGEQGYFLSKGLKQPKRCPECRLARKVSLEISKGGGD